MNITPDTLSSSAICGDSAIVSLAINNSGLNPLYYSFDDPCSWIVIEINTSYSAWVISWELEDGYGNSLLTGTGYSDYSTYYDSICLPAGQYSFVYNSAYSTWYGGTYNVSSCGNLLANNNGISPVTNGQESFLFNGCGYYSPWISHSKYADTIPVNGNDTVNFIFHSTNLNAGVHEANVLIHTNETPGYMDTVHCIFTVSGSPQLAVTDTCIKK